MGPIVFGNEIEVWDGSRMEGCQKGFLTGVADGGGREPEHKVGIVRGLTEQMFFGQISVKIFNSINHGGITLEGNISFQAIVKNGRDKRFLFKEGGFFSMMEAKMTACFSEMPNSDAR